MSKFVRVLAAGLIAGAMLAACGGGSSDGGAMGSRQAGQGIAVGEPNGGVPVASEFIKLAREAGCTSERNRLFVIDDKYVVWDRAGNCADASWGLSLMGATPEAVLCSAGDSIAGPRTTCADESARSLFETIRNKLDKDDLGTGRKVEQIRFLPKSGEAIAFRPLIRESFSGVKEARQVVVTDAAAWNALWAEHSAGRNPAPAPQVDFSKHMVVGVFSGEHNSGCWDTAILRVGALDERIVVEYEIRDITPVAICLPVVTQPAQLVVIDKLDAKVEFLRVQSGFDAFRTLDATNRSRIAAPRDVVVRDATAWQQLWAEHAGADAKAPAVDFATQMVIGVFLGAQPTSCHNTGIDRVAVSPQRILVRHVDTQPGPNVFCGQALNYPAHLIAVERSEAPVEFASEIRILQ